MRRGSPGPALLIYADSCFSGYWSVYPSLRLDNVIVQSSCRMSQVAQDRLSFSKVFRKVQQGEMAAEQALDSLGNEPNSLRPQQHPCHYWPPLASPEQLMLPNGHVMRLLGPDVGKRRVASRPASRLAEMLHVMQWEAESRAEELVVDMALLRPPRRARQQLLTRKSYRVVKECLAAGVPLPRGYGAHAGAELVHRVFRAHRLHKEGRNYEALATLERIREEIGRRREELRCPAAIEALSWCVTSQVFRLMGRDGHKDTAGVQADVRQHFRQSAYEALQRSMCIYNLNEFPEWLMCEILMNAVQYSGIYDVGGISTVPYHFIAKVYHDVPNSVAKIMSHCFRHEAKANKSNLEKLNAIREELVDVAAAAELSQCLDIEVNVAMAEFCVLRLCVEAGGCGYGARLGEVEGQLHTWLHDPLVTEQQRWEVQVLLQPG